MRGFPKGILEAHHALDVTERKGGRVEVGKAKRHKTRVPLTAGFFSRRQKLHEGFFPSIMENLHRTGGRPPHHPSPTDRRVVELLAAEGIPQSQICRVLEIDEKTLRKHFRRELDRGAAKLEAALIGHLLRLTSGNDGVALRAIKFALQSRFGWSEFLPKI